MAVLENRQAQVIVAEMLEERLNLSELERAAVGAGKGRLTHPSRRGLWQARGVGFSRILHRGQCGL